MAESVLVTVFNTRMCKRKLRKREKFKKPNDLRQANAIIVVFCNLQLILISAEPLWATKSEMTVWGRSFHTVREARQKVEMPNGQNFRGGLVIFIVLQRTVWAIKSATTVVHVFAKYWQILSWHRVSKTVLDNTQVAAEHRYS